MARNTAANAAVPRDVCIIKELFEPRQANLCLRAFCHDKF